MSDRETVSFDPNQFDRFMQRFSGVHAELQIIRERLGPVDKDKLIQQTLEAVVEALGTSGNSNIENKLDQLFVKLSTIEHQQVLLLELIEGETGPITNLQRKVTELMATQEERLRAILTAVQNVKQMLADLKVNNPAIEDEITAIEKELAPASEEPPTT